MLTALVLVCSLTLTPDIADCNHKNALDIMRVPDEFANPVTCFMQGQAYLAETAIGRRLTKDHAVKIICMPTATVDKSRVRPLPVD
jgi:hypothetical protein